MGIGELYHWIKIRRAPTSPNLIQGLQKNLELPELAKNNLHGENRKPSSTGDDLDLCDQIYQVFCQKAGETKDPTGSVHPDLDGEKRAFQLFSQLTKEHPNWTQQQVDEELVRQIFNPRRKFQIESVFRWVLQTMESFFDQSIEFTSYEKHLIRGRLYRTQLQLPPPASIYADEPDLLTKNEVYYERTLGGEMRLRVGGAYLFTAKSKFNLIFTLAHELAHAIDPCEIRSAHMAFPGYDRLTACFLDTGIIARRKTRSECGANDQLSEVFADWVAVQITARALEDFATEFDHQQIIAAARNSVRDLCDQEPNELESDLEFHPSPAIRIGVFGKNPKIRALLGCRPLASLPSYCTFDWKKIKGK